MLLLLMLGLLASDNRISVEKHAPTTQFASFDPAHPPADVAAKLKHGEDALTRMLFNCTVHLKYEAADPEYRDGKWHAVARLGEVNVTLELTDTIYLPKNANDKLRAHELGHAKINGIVYRTDAEEAAHAAATAGLEKRWQGAGATPDDAAKRASDAAVDWIAKDYLHRTADKAYRIGEIYDDLTEHGTNKMLVDDAIREAIEKQSQPKQPG